MATFRGLTLFSCFLHFHFIRVALYSGTIYIATVVTHFAFLFIWMCVYLFSIEYHNCRFTADRRSSLILKTSTAMGFVKCTVIVGPHRLYRLDFVFFVGFRVYLLQIRESYVHDAVKNGIVDAGK
jgi:hypothetical protein